MHPPTHTHQRHPLARPLFDIFCRTFNSVFYHTRWNRAVGLKRSCRSQENLLLAALNFLHATRLGLQIKRVPTSLKDCEALWRRNVMEVRHKWLSAGRVVCQESRWAVLQKKDKYRKNWAKTHAPVFLKWCLKVILMMRKCQNSYWSGLPLQREYAPCQLANIRRQRIQSNVYNVKIELYRFMFHEFSTISPAIPKQWGSLEFRLKMFPIESW